MSSDSIRNSKNSTLLSTLTLLVILVVGGLVGTGVYSLHHGIHYLSSKC